METCPNGRYVRSSEVLGRGGFKVVYKAYDSKTSMEVAWSEVPFLESGAMTNDVYSEIRVLSSIEHKNVMRLFFWWHDRKRKMLVLITELFVPGSIKTHLKNYYPVSMTAIALWLTQIVSALEALHGSQRPILHRDIKCDNIFINSNTGEVKLGDLGSSLVKSTTRGTSIVGTPSYMAPEVFEGSYDASADIYSLGMAIVEMVTNKVPYAECKNMAQIYKKVLSGIPPLTVVQMPPTSLKHLVLGCLAPAEDRITLKQIMDSPFFFDPEASIASINEKAEPRIKSFGYIVDMAKKKSH